MSFRRNSPIDHLLAVVDQALNLGNSHAAAARANPQGIAYGSGGVGTINHLGAEMLAAMARIQLLHQLVPTTFNAGFEFMFSFSVHSRGCVFEIRLAK